MLLESPRKGDAELLRCYAPRSSQPRVPKYTPVSVLRFTLLTAVRDRCKAGNYSANRFRIGQSGRVSPQHASASSAKVVRISINALILVSNSATC